MASDLQQIRVRVSPEALEFLDAMCERNKRSRDFLVNQVVEAWMRRTINARHRRETNRAGSQRRGLSDRGPAR